MFILNNLLHFFYIVHAFLLLFTVHDINKEEKTIRRKDEGQRETQYDSV